MNKKLTKSEMKSYLKRWKMVNKKERELLQKTPFSTKLLQFLSLMASAHLFGAYAAKEKENRIAYQRWQTIRRRIKNA